MSLHAKASIINLSLLSQRSQSFSRFFAGEMRCQMVARFLDHRVPRQVFPKAQLLSGQARTLGKSIDKLLAQRIDCLVELLIRNHVVDQAPEQRFVCRDGLGGEEQFARATLGDDKWQPMRGAGRRQEADLRFYLNELRV